MEEEDENIGGKKPSKEFQCNLEKMSIDDLEDYLLELKNEIEKVKIEMDKKDSAKKKAEDIFK